MFRRRNPKRYDYKSEALRMLLDPPQSWFEDERNMKWLNAMLAEVALGMWIALAVALGVWIVMAATGLLKT